MTSKTDKENVDEITECPDCKSTHLKRDYDSFGSSDLIAPVLGKITIKRPQKFGGNLTFDSYLVPDYDSLCR